MAAKKRLSKRSKGIIILATVGFALICSLLNAKIYPFTKIEVSGNYVDNSYNNHLAGGLISRVGDNLYLTYPFNMLPVELNNEGSKRFSYSGAKRFRRMPIFRLYSYSNDDILVFNERGYTKEGELYGYKLNVDKYSLDPMKENLYSVYLEYNFCHIDADTIVYLENEEYSSNLCIKMGDSAPNVIDQNVQTFYYCDGDVYYLDGDNDFCKYNIETEAIVGEIYHKNSIYSADFLVHEGNLVFVDTSLGKIGQRDGMVQLVIYDMKRDEKTVLNLPEVTFPHYCHLNACDEKIYYSTRKGLFVYDIESQQKTTLQDGYVGGCYIFDDTWVYYQGYFGTLWRITQDGQNLEKVYGW